MTAHDDHRAATNQFKEQLMAFQLPDDVADTAGALRELEAQAPKAIKPLMLQAANELDKWRQLAATIAGELEEASRLRIGQMDTQSKTDEIVRQIQTVLTTAAERLRHE